MTGRRLILTLALVLVAVRVQGQVLATADTLGKGKTGVLFTDNELYAGDGIRLNIAYAEWARGLSDRFDLLVAVGETTTEGTTQAWAGGGGNLHLVKAGRASVSLFDVVSVPVTRRDEASLVLLNSALIVSTPIGSKVYVYSGVNSLMPIGERSRGVFTPPDTKVNVPLGLTCAIGPWSVWGEFDAGPLKALGVGLARVF